MQTKRSVCQYYVNNSSCREYEASVNQMSSIYFESNGKTLETQPEFLGEYSFGRKKDGEIFPRQKLMLDNSTSYYFRVKSFQVEGDNESPVYFQKGQSSCPTGLN